MQIEKNISFTRYVDITSGVIGDSGTPDKELTGNFFTNNTLLPVESFSLFDNELGVGNFFGYDSIEYKQALSYMGYTSKNVTKAKKIMFTRLATAETFAYARGSEKILQTDLASIVAITNGGFTLTSGSTDTVVTGGDFSTAGNFDDVATTLQAMIQGAGAPYDQALVSFNATLGVFIIDLQKTGSFEIGTETNGLLTALKLKNDVIYSKGQAGESVTQLVSKLVNSFNNFGSMVISDQSSLGADDAEILQSLVPLAQLNAGFNVEFMLFVQVTKDNYQDYSDAFKDIASVGLIKENVYATFQDTTQFLYSLPMAALAATNYKSINANINYMYLQNSGFLTATVQDDPKADLYDAAKVNYYGRTQVNGQIKSFFQRGILCGNSSEGALVDMNVHANEQFLKADLQKTAFDLLEKSELSAGGVGEAKLRTAFTGGVGETGSTGSDAPIPNAIRAGIISTSKTFSTEQRQAIEQITGNKNDYLEIESDGYKLIINTVEYTNSNTGNTEYKLVYTLVYSKNDQIRKIEGRDLLV